MKWSSSIIYFGSLHYLQITTKLIIKIIHATM